MFIPITNTPRPYAWGSTSAIPSLLGTPETGGPQAELWLGTHPGSPSRLVTPLDGAVTLADLLAAAAVGGVPAGVPGGAPAGVPAGVQKMKETVPETGDSVPVGADSGDASFVFGEGQLPFLLKILAAAGPLSLQAHPTAAQAAAGFARENALGIPLDAAHRNYKDAHPKPEIIVALSDTFDALCGFREPAETAQIVRMLGDAPELAAFASRLETEPLSAVFEWLITRGPGVAELVAGVTDAARAAEPRHPGEVSGVVPKTKELSTPVVPNGAKTRGSGAASFVFGTPAAIATGTAADAAVDTVRMLASEYPGDPGIVVSLLLNRVTLRRGEALFLPAGNIHAYLRGLGVELMTASDNVLRGGLTPKHIDVPELLGVLDFAPQPVPWLRPILSGGAKVFAPSGADFRLVHVDGAGEVVLDAAAIAICTRGTAVITGDESSVTLRRGDSVFVTEGERMLRFDGDAEVFVASGR